MVNTPSPDDREFDELRKSLADLRSDLKSSLDKSEAQISDTQKSITKLDGQIDKLSVVIDGKLAGEISKINAAITNVDNTWRSSIRDLESTLRLAIKDVDSNFRAAIAAVETSLRSTVSAVDATVRSLPTTQWVVGGIIGLIGLANVGLVMFASSQIARLDAKIDKIDEATRKIGSDLLLLQTNTANSFGGVDRRLMDIDRRLSQIAPPSPPTPPPPPPPPPIPGPRPPG